MSLEIPLPDERVAQLEQLADAQGVPVAELGRQAVEDWLDARANAPDEERFRERLGALLDERARVASEAGWDAEAVEEDVARAVREVRGDQSDH